MIILRMNRILELRVSNVYATIINEARFCIKFCITFILMRNTLQNNIDFICKLFYVNFYLYFLSFM